MQFGEKVYLACDETNWLTMTETKNQEKGLKLEMAMGGVQQGRDPWFESHQKTNFWRSMPSLTQKMDCVGDTSIFSECLLAVQK